jgi:hypothetical protein
MQKPRSAFLILALLTVALSWALPGPEVTEPCYNESEGFPYEVSSPFSNVMSSITVLGQAVVASDVRPSAAAPRPMITLIALGGKMAAHPLAELCTFLC